MKCPRCQAENPPGMRFCGQCAAPLKGAPGPRFVSPEAYTPKHLAKRIINSKAALEGERKQVTVLFADLKDSMELLADRDPEEARKLLDPVLEHMMEAVTATRVPSLSNSMDRRRFLLTTLAGALAAPLAADGQVSTKIARIGMLRSENRPLDERIRQNIADVRAGLQDEGYAEGQHYRIDYYSPTSKVDVVKIARTLVRDKVDVIHAIAHVAIEAARKATTIIPIVAHDYETDPIAAGFVATLAKPGGNITGMFLDLPDISGKLLELIKMTLPGLRRIEVFWDPLTSKAQVLAVERAAKALGIEINIIEARAGSLEQTVRYAADRKASALLLLGSPVVSSEFPKIAEATTAARLPTIAIFPAFARLGGLMAYGPDAPDQYRQEGRMIAKILKGTKPADLPVERPTKFYFLINVKTAKALGLTIPPSLLLRADQVIE